MEFFSTYYKKLANYDQIKQIGEKFNQLDADGDKGLSKNELVNIFAQAQCAPLTEAEKDALMAGLDSDNDGFLTYTEFIPAFLEFDVDQDAEITEGEFDYVKKRISELEKQHDINERYQTLNSLTATEQQKQTAQNEINVFEVERRIIYAEQDIKKKSILVGNIDLKIGEIDQFLNNNVLLPFDEAQKIKEKEKFEVEKTLLLLKKDISVKKLDLETVNLQIITKEQQGGFENELTILAQQKLSRENLLSISERNLEQHHLSVKIENNENLLTKFFVPEVIKDSAKKELEKQRDQNALLVQRIDLYSKVSALSITRASLLDLGYQYQQTQDPALLPLIEQLEEDQDNQQLAAQISSLKVELIDKQIQLKDVLPRADYKPFDQVKADLEADIAALQSQIAALEA